MGTNRYIIPPPYVPTPANVIQSEINSETKRFDIKTSTELKKADSDFKDRKGFSPLGAVKGLEPTYKNFGEGAGEEAEG